MAGRVLAVRRFTDWYDGLSAFDAGLANYVIGLLRGNPYNLGHPYSSQLRGRVRELRVVNVRHPLRMAYALDRERDVVLLTGGNKRGLDGRYAQRFAEDMARVAGEEFEDHLMDPRFAIPFVPRDVGQITPDAAEEEEGVRQQGRHKKPRSGPTKYAPSQWSKDIIDKIQRATGWTRHEIIGQMQPGKFLDPDDPDAKKRIEDIIARFSKPPGGTAGLGWLYWM